MLIIAGCAALISMGFALFGLFKDRLITSQSGQTALPTATVSATLKAGPNSDRPVVELAQPNQSSSSSAATLPSEDKRQAIVNDLIQLWPGRFRSYRFDVKSEYRNPHVTGLVTAAGGGRDDVYVVIMDEQGFRAFTSGNNASTYFRSRVLGSKNIRVELRPGAYQLILSNIHARFYRKQVEARLYLEFE
jgi:hypothetical protein